MEFVEGVGESSSPPRTFRSFSGYGIANAVYNRLVEIGNEEAIAHPEFRDQLKAHFNRLPDSYAQDIDLDRVEDVLLHHKLLLLAKKLETRPVFHVGFAENFWIGEDDDEEKQESTVVSHAREVDIHVPPIHEVIFSAVDKPKLLSQLSALLSDIGLNIREAHVFSTTDGYALDVFVVDGWPIQETQALRAEMARAITRSECSWSGSSDSNSAIEKALGAEANRVDTEIDIRLLKVGEKIASGSCGDLHRGVYFGQQIAVKILRSENLNEALEAEFSHEVAILREVQHKNVVRFIGACTKKPHLCIITEYMHGGSLFEYLHKRRRRRLTLTQLVRFAIDVCRGMEYLHKNNMIHRDLKTANLLIDSHNVVKVADFGLARFQNQEGVMTAETGTYKWMAPEILKHEPYGQKADVFSFAIVLWELVTARIPYDNMTPLQAALEVRQGLRPKVPTNTHPKVLELMQRCWETDPESRPTFSEIKVELKILLEEIQQENANGS